MIDATATTGTFDTSPARLHHRRCGSGRSRASQTLEATFEFWPPGAGCHGVMDRPPSTGQPSHVIPTMLAVQAATKSSWRTLGSLYKGQVYKHIAYSHRYMSVWPKVAPKRIRIIRYACSTEQAHSRAILWLCWHSSSYVLFSCDVTGTLVSFRGTLEEHYLGAARKCGVTNIDSSLISPSFHQAYQQISRHYPCFGNTEISSKEWWRQCVSLSFHLAGVSLDDYKKEQIFQRIYCRFGSHAAYEAFPDAVPFLKWANRRGIVCGVLSNADERYGDSILPMLGFTHDELSFWCFSKEFNLEKPDARFYMAAINEAKPWTSHTACKPCEVLHIGNDFRRDFDGARRAGMHAVLLDRYNEPELANEWKRRGAPVFKDLLDVVEFLGRSNCILG